MRGMAVSTMKLYVHGTRARTYDVDDDELPIQKRQSARGQTA